MINLFNRRTNERIAKLEAKVEALEKILKVYRSFDLAYKMNSDLSFETRSRVIDDLTQDTGIYGGQR
jgi:hypothetical protein